MTRNQRYTLILSILFCVMWALTSIGMDVGFFLALHITIGELILATIFWLGFFKMLEWAERGK